MKPALLFAALALAAAGCYGNHGPSAGVARTPNPGNHADLSRVAVATAPIDDTVFPPAAAALVAALRAPASAGLGGRVQLLAPEQFRATSALDLQRLGTGAATGRDAVLAGLAADGWRWQLLQDGLGLSSGYRQLRVAALGFATPAGAAAYLANPFLLPASLANAQAVPAPAFLNTAGASARLLHAADAITPLIAPTTVLPGSRAALLWRRGSLVLAVMLFATPSVVGDETVLAMARALDERAADIPGVEAGR